MKYQIETSKNPYYIVKDNDGYFMTQDDFSNSTDTEVIAKCDSEFEAECLLSDYINYEDDY